MFMNCLLFHRSYKEIWKKNNTTTQNYSISYLLSFPSVDLRTYTCVYKTEEKSYCYNFVFPISVTLGWELISKSIENHRRF